MLKELVSNYPQKKLQSNKMEGDKLFYIKTWKFLLFNLLVIFVLSGFIPSDIIFLSLTVLLFYILSIIKL